MNTKMRILFVDDEPAILAGLRNLLFRERQRWEMCFVADASLAIEAFRAQPFDVVVSDMRMPGMDGATLLAHLRDEFPATLRIMLSGYAENEALERAMPALDRLLSKPCDGATLRRAIEQGATKAELVPTPRVLLVNDDPRVLDSMAALLRREFDIVTATSSDEALARMTDDPTIQVVVSDTRTQGIDGVALLARIHALAPRSIRILLTGEGNPEDAAVSSGTVSEVLLKPCSRADLRDTIHTLSQQSLARAT